MWKVSTQAAGPSAGDAQLAGSHENLAVREMGKAAVMTHVQMGEHHPLHVARPDAPRAQLRTDLLVMLDAELDLPSDIGLQRLSGFEQMRACPVSTTTTPSRCSMAHA